MELSSRVWQVAAKVEQEIRAYPRVYSAFYRALNASPAVRRGVGRAKAGVREDGSRAGAPAAVAAPSTPATRRRSAALAVRLGLPPEPGL